jgi:hypothetical protein
MEPIEEGVDFLNLDKRKTLIFWASRWLNTKGNDTIIRRLKRDKVWEFRNARFSETCTERRIRRSTSSRRKRFRENDGK